MHLPRAQSHFASLPAGIEDEELTSAKAYTARRHRKQTSIEEKLRSPTWASRPKVHHQQTSQEEKLTLAMALVGPSQPSRHRRRVDIKLALTKGIASRHQRKKADIQLASTRGRHHRHQREEVDISAQTKGIIDSRHRSRAEKLTAAMASKHCIASTSHILWIHTSSSTSSMATASGTSIHCTQNSCIIASSTCVMSQESS